MLFKNTLTRLVAVFGAAFAIQAAPVTFRIDVASLVNQAVFVPGTDRIEVRGEFNNWSAGSVLTRTAEDSTIYSGTFEVPGAAGAWTRFKFWRTPDTWESTPDRLVKLTGEALTLPIATYNKVTEVDPLLVTFQVNMATQIAAGQFKPQDGDVVNARGEFNSWGKTPLAPSETNPDIYVGEAFVNFAPGNPIAYKFHMDRPGRPEIWEDNQAGSTDRIYYLTGEVGEKVPVVYFNDQTGTPINAALDVAVNLNAQILKGAFNKETQQVWLRGNQVGWNDPPADGSAGDGRQLFEDASRPGVYTNRIVMPGVVTGANVAFKFTIWNPETRQTVWEGGNDKIVTFTGTEPLVDGNRLKSFGPVFFNGELLSDLLSADTTVTFRVDMTNAKRTGTDTAFDPLTEGVWINGDFLGWPAWNQDPDRQLFDDGVTSGDVTAGDKIYTFTRVFPKGSSARVQYKYGIAGADNEAGFGQDHIRYIRSTGTYVMPIDIFGTMDREESFGNLKAVKGPNNQITLTWQGRPGVRLEKVDLATKTGTEVPNTDGQSSLNYTASAQMEFFRLVQP